MFLKEDKYKEKTGKRFKGDIEKFRNAIGKPDYFIHFTDVPKLGIKPKTTFLPGIYAYPLTKKVYNKFFADVDEFARGMSRAARYVFLLKLKPGVSTLDGKDVETTIIRNFKYCMEPITDENLIAPFPKGEMYLSYEDMGEFIEKHNFDDFKKKLKELRRGFYGPLERPYKIGDAFDNTNDWIMKNNHGPKKKMQMLASLLERLFPGNKNNQVYLRNEIFSNNKKGESLRAKLTLYNAFSDNEASSLNIERILYLVGDHPLFTNVKGTFELSNFRSTAIAMSDPNNKRMKNRIELFIKLEMVSNSKGGIGELNDTTISKKDGGTVTLKSITDNCFQRFSEISGMPIEKIQKLITERDFIGINLLLCGKDHQVIIDRGYAADDVSGWQGILGNLESSQAFIRPPIAKCVEIEGMVDRFEGVPETAKIPGSATPDKDYGVESDKEWQDKQRGIETDAWEPNLRTRELRKKFYGKNYKEPDRRSYSGGIPSDGVMKPTERWKDVKVESIIRNKIRLMLRMLD